jgi:hypothetical protein
MLFSFLHNNNNNKYFIFYNSKWNVYNIVPYKNVVLFGGNDSEKKLVHKPKQRVVYMCKLKRDNGGKKKNRRFE